jgi:DNA-binding transcriptional ArsR family regulator
LSEEQKKIQRIEEKIDSIIKMLQEHFSTEREVTVPSQKMDIPLSAPISVYLLKLPDSLRQTMLAMDRLTEATTSQVATETGRSRSVESIHLNQLERMGYIDKFRKGRKVFFRIPEPPSKEKQETKEEKTS